MAHFFRMNQQSPLAQFDALLPLAAAWATEQEHKVLRDDIALSLEEMADARAIGFKQPNRVRLLRIETIPRPMQQCGLAQLALNAALAY